MLYQLRGYERKDRAVVSTISALDAGKEAFIEGVTRGVDRPLPLGVSTPRQWPISTFLGECSKHSQALLFAACNAALADRSIEAAAKLKAFVDHVAAEYASDSEELWEQQP